MANALRLCSKDLCTREAVPFLAFCSVHAPRQSNPPRKIDSISAVTLEVETSQPKQLCSGPRHKRPERFGKACPVCCDLAHRRPRVGVCRCGLPFAAEDMTEALAECRERRRSVERG